MYRQIRVHKDDWPLQKLLWRNSPCEILQEYHLCTVMYGLACAPYLALRCLRQLAIELAASHAFATDILQRDTYVDDVLSGAADITLAKEQIRQLNDVLTAGGFKLRKWIANDSEILADIPLQDQDISSTFLVDDKATHHTLGLQWNRPSDNFIFSAPSLPESAIDTKRSVLPFIARMFDPLGWLAPIIIIAKIFLQELWAIRLDWDEELLEELQARWTTFTRQIEHVKTISIPRWYGTSAFALAIEIHGFSDASQSALAAVVFVRVLNEIDDARVNLVSAKTKVAPLKSMTIPRLELAAAVLLVHQVLGLREVLDLHNVPIHLSTDSTVVLAWIKSHPSRWKDFVRNRVSFIQQLSNSRWHHVSGKKNPADLASRGISPQFLQKELLWWKGPSWLRNHSSSWPSSTATLDSTTTLEERPSICTLAIKQSESAVWDVIKRYSSLTTLFRVTAWLLRARDRLCRPSSDQS